MSASRAVTNVRAILPHRRAKMLIHGKRRPVAQLTITARGTCAWARRPGVAAAERLRKGHHREGSMSASSRKGERLAGLFLLGCLLFNYPLLALFNVPARVLGVPVLYAYLFAAWALLIALVAAVMDARDCAGRTAAGLGHRLRFVRLHRAAVRDRLLRRHARATAGRSVIANPWIYSLSLAVYATAWTFYGSVGRAATRRHRLPADLPRPDADDAAVVVRAAQDDPHQQAEPHHLARRLRRRRATARARCSAAWSR